MKHAWRMLVALFAIAALAVGAGTAAADHGNGHHGGHGDKHRGDRVFTFAPDPSGNPEGVAVEKRSRSFFVGITTDGTIYRGTTGQSTLTPFIPGAAGKSAVGMKVRRGLLYVAGGSTGTITVYDLATKQAVATFQTGPDGFLNDLVVTRHGDVYVTDSFRPTLWHVTNDQVKAGGGTPQALDVSAIPFQGGGAFNLNGIVAKSDRKLIVVDSATGQLFRIKLNRDGDAIDAIDEVAGVNVPGGDGMLLDRGRLIVVQGNPAQLTFVKLRHGARSGRLDGTRTSAELRGPSTVARAQDLYLVVNADFATSQRPFTVAGLDRRGGRHGHGHGGH
jgi:sugar lactone lactonase YvrE